MEQQVEIPNDAANDSISSDSDAKDMEEPIAEKTHIQQLYVEAGIEETDALWLAVDDYIDRYDEAGIEEWQEGQIFLKDV